MDMDVEYTNIEFSAEYVRRKSAEITKAKIFLTDVS